MVKNFLLLWTLICAHLIGGYVDNFDLPEEFTVTQRWVSWTTTFDIATKDEVIGTVHRKFFSLVPEYHFMDRQENLLALGRMRLFTFFAVFDVEDYLGNPLGTVEEEFSWLFPTFSIISPDGELLGEAVLDFWGTTYTISDPVDGRPFITMTRPYFQLKSNWVVKIEDLDVVIEKEIHPHLLMTLAAFQVDREYWRKQRARHSYVEGLCRDLSINDDDSLSKDSFANIREDFRKKLESHRLKLVCTDPTEEDFLFIESLTNFTCSSREIEELTIKVDQLFDLLSSDQITDSQKSALFRMLEDRFNDY